MTGRRLPRSYRGRALPRSGPATVTWPRALAGRPVLLCLLLLGWLGGGLFATAVAVVTQTPQDLSYGLTHTVAAFLALLLVAAVPREAPWRRGRAAAQPAPVLGEPLPVRVPDQMDPEHNDRRGPALRSIA